MPDSAPTERRYLGFIGTVKLLGYRDAPPGFAFLSCVRCGWRSDSPMLMDAAKVSAQAHMQGHIDGV